MLTVSFKYKKYRHIAEVKGNAEYPNSKYLLTYLISPDFQNLAAVLYPANYGFS